MTPAEHRSVMVEEVMAHLADIREGLLVDGTVGLGGHAFEMLSRTREPVRLLGMDRDPDAVEAASARLAPFGSRAAIVHRGYEELARVLAEMTGELAALILLDLGLSSAQLASGRGFSFRDADAPLDARFDPGEGATAAEVIRSMPEHALASAFRSMAQVPAAGRLARRVKEQARAGRMNTAGDLAAACHAALGQRVRKMDSATLPFEAVRILVNSELTRLATFLDSLPSVTAGGGKVLVISYHSGEDAIVKAAFRGLAAGGGWRLVTRKPLRPGPDEVASNRRSRSAKMRAIVRERTP